VFELNAHGMILVGGLAFIFCEAGAVRKVHKFHRDLKPLHISDV